MKRLGIFALLLLLLSLAGEKAFEVWKQRQRVFIFAGVSGPSDKSVVTSMPPTPWARYHQGNKSRMAILLTQPDSNWLGLAHGLKTIGIPFDLTTNYQDAIQHAVVLAYPEVSGAALTPPALRALASFARQGGTLIAFNVLGGLQDVFGFKEAAPTNVHTRIHWNHASPLTAEFTDPKEQDVPFEPAEKKFERMGSYSYTNPVAPPLAFYEDGSAAITSRAVGKGHVYAWGMDLGAFLLKGYDNREEDIARSYVNEFEPALDVFLRLLRTLYQHGEKDAVVLGTVPEGKSLTVLLTHDIDYTQSVENSLQYAAYEQQQGIEATYFLQTKYVKDFNDDVFFNARELPSIRQIAAHGMEMASHTVCHSKAFRHFPLGTGDEKYPEYQPFVHTAEVTEGGSVLGELRISKFLMEDVAKLPPVVSFRPGHLSNPYSLPQALVATGYRYSSSVTANNSLTHLPFQLNDGRETAAETDIFEFPITVEDEAPPEMVQRLPEALTLARAISRYNGLFVILIHPNIVGQKMQFEQGFVEKMKPTAWFGSIAHFGAWWHARNNVDVDVAENGHRVLVSLTVPEKIKGLTLQIPKGWTYQKAGSNTEPASVTGQTLVLGEVQGAVQLLFNNH